MMRNVYLQGELGKRFGNKFSMDVDTHQEIIKCINANRSEFKNYLIDCDKNDIAFTIEYQNELVTTENLLIPLKEGDVTIAILPAGSKSGIGKIIAAAFLVFVALPAMGAYTIGGMTMAQTSALAAASGASTVTGLSMAAALGTIPGQIVGLLAVNLAMAGIQQMMAPDPAVDKDAPENYSFNGNTQNITQGDPIPILYGELRVPGRPISVEVSNRTPQFAGEYTDSSGNVDSISSNSTKEIRQTQLK